MDTQFKFGAMTRSEKVVTFDGWCMGCNEYRTYIGPKGWIIAYNENLQTWEITHHYYSDLQLTLLNPDEMPMGRHTWRAEKNVCNQGQTNSMVLQIGGCQERGFTCDDGKCVTMEQRCNNIEVRVWSKLINRAAVTIISHNSFSNLALPTGGVSGLD